MAAQNLATNLNALIIRIDSFDGSDNSNPEKFVKSLRQYLIATGKVSPDQIQDRNQQWIDNPNKGAIEKEVLRMHLKGAAKSWYNQLDEDTDFEECLEQLIDRFKLTPHQKHAKKSAVFQMKQKTGETYQDFVSRVVDFSTGIDLSNEDLVTILIHGAEPGLRNFLIMQQPNTISDLMKIPLTRGGHVNTGKNNDMEFVGSVDMKTAQRANSANPKVRFREPGYRPSGASNVYQQGQHEETAGRETRSYPARDYQYDGRQVNEADNYRPR